LGHKVRAAAPVLACRELIEAGHDPGLSCQPDLTGDMLL
jgi:hypothetical protein